MSALAVAVPGQSPPLRLATLVGTPEMSIAIDEVDPSTPIVGIEQGKIWASQTGLLKAQIFTHLPPALDDLRRIGWGERTTGAELAVGFNFTDLHAFHRGRQVIAFEDGQPVRCGVSLPADLELRCGFITGMRLLLGGLPLSQVVRQVEMSGDPIQLARLAGACARIDVLDSHRWLSSVLTAIEEHQPGWAFALDDRGGVLG